MDNTLKRIIEQREREQRERELADPRVFDKRKRKGTYSTAVHLRHPDRPHDTRCGYPVEGSKLGPPATCKRCVKWTGRRRP